MDTQNDHKIADCGEMADLITGKSVVGAKQLRKALEKGRARHVYLAENADPAITDPIAALCREYHVRCTWVRSMTDLGRACGIDVGAAAAAAVD